MRVLLYPPLEPGELLRGTRDVRFREAWETASASTFRPSCHKRSGRKARERIPTRCFIAMVHQKPSCGATRLGIGTLGIMMVSLLWR